MIRRPLFRMAPALVPLSLACAPGALANLMLSPTMTFSQEGGTLNPSNLAIGGTAIAKDVLGNGAYAPTHTIPNVNNGTYGNGSSWIGDSADSWVGVRFGTSRTIQSFAFGRDNTGQFGDRTLGTYTVQWTNDPLVQTNPAGATWNTVGTVNYGTFAGGGSVTTPSVRHLYNLNTPVNALGFRLITPGAGIGSGAAIDELEVYSAAGASVAPIVTTAAPGFSITWDGNDGDNYNASAAPTVPNNIALASRGSTPIASGQLGPELGISYHLTRNINDGLYGNTNSWIGGSNDPGPHFAGVMFNGLYNISSVAWGRDNGNESTEGAARDRSMGTYTLQITPDGNLWTTVGTVNYNYGQDTELGSAFTPSLRHEFEIASGGNPITARGFRVLVPGSGINGGTAIDEIEVYGTPIPEPSALLLLGAAVLPFTRRRRTS